MAVIEFVMIVIAALVSVLIAQPDIFSDESWEYLSRLFLLLMVPASIPVVCYEVAPTAWHGQTFGKRLLGIRVVRWDDQVTRSSELECPDPLHSFLRWAIPHGACLVLAVVSGVVSYPMVQRGATWFVFYGISGGIGVWALLLVYLSSVLDENGRGWHDKAAGTIMVKAPDPHMRE